MQAPEQVQIHVTLPYKSEPRSHPEIGRYLEAGYSIIQWQRLTDRDALVTFARDRESHSSA